ncbi:MAG TPA: KR domain-containing protein, partial [Kofleriaceae bacterium]|nr:KR domain-containing protein [Kofleriaceae bacterium]
IHVAGLPARGLVQGKSRDEADQVMAAKTHGTWVLDAACAGDPLEFFVLCSSRTAVLGGPGQVDYCAGNAFQDAFAEWKRATTSAQVTAIAWDTWRDTGMARSAALPGVATGEPISHPLLQRRIRATDSTDVFAATISTADSWIVDEHRMMGHGLVPGTTYMEMVRAAVAPHAAGREVELRDVLFMLPVIVPDGQTRELYTTIERGSDAIRFKIQSRAPGSPSAWQDHATGSVVFHDPEPHPVRSLDELRAACEVAEVIESEQALRRRLRLDFAAEGGIIRFAVHGRWRCLSRIEAGPRGLVAMLELPEAYAADLETFQLHPALLDVVGGASRIRAGEGYYLPFWYRSLRVVHGLARRMHCHIRIKEADDSGGETLTCDVDVFDEAGQLLIQIGDFVMKRVHQPEAMRDQVERASLAPSEVAPGEPHGALALLRAMHDGMTATEAVEVFRRVMATEPLPAHVVVSTRDLPALQQIAASIDPAQLTAEVEHGASPTTVHPRPELATPYVAPATDIERQIAAIWQDVLGIDAIGVDDDFFALGGHSLAAVQIGTRLRSQLGAELVLREFFERPTVASTARMLAAATGAIGAEPAERIEPLRRDELGEVSLDELSDEQVDAMLRQMLAAESAQQGSMP